MTLDPNSPVPLYRQIEIWLRAQIESGALHSHSRLPSERQLAGQFVTSRVTVTRALKELERAGLVYSQVAKGTFVAPQGRIDQKVETLTSFSEDMAVQNKIVDSRVLSMTVRPAVAEVAEALDIPLGSDVFVLQRVRRADGVPVALETTHVVYWKCANIEKQHDFSVESLYNVLRTECGLHLKSAQETIGARLPTSFESSALEIPLGQPVLHFTRTTFDQHGTPVELVRSAYRADCYQIHIELKPPLSVRSAG